MATYAIIENGVVMNMVVWDGKTEWSPPEGTEAIECNDDSCQIGGSYMDGVFIPPPLPVPTHEDQVEEAEEMKTCLLKEANNFTGPWQTQLLLGIINDADKASLTDWMKYYQNLQAVDTSAAPNIDWPTKPE